jgi:hypothetical protein
VGEQVHWFFALVGAIVALYAAIRMRDGWRWKVLLGAVGVHLLAMGAEAVLLLSVLATMTVGFEQVMAPAGVWILLVYAGARLRLWQIAFLAIFPATIILDLPRRGERDWAHWLGVAMLCMSGLASIAHWNATVPQPFYMP